MTDDVPVINDLMRVWLGIDSRNAKSTCETCEMHKVCNFGPQPNKVTRVTCAAGFLLCNYASSSGVTTLRISRDLPVRTYVDLESFDNM